MNIRQCYIVCFVARSGSNLLCELLRNTKVAGRPHQYFWGLREAKWAEKYDLDLSDYRQYVTGIIERSATRNGVFGMKASYSVLDDFARRAKPVFDGAHSSKAEFLAGIFPAVHYVWIARRDKLRQAISFARAKQTMVWTSKQAQPGAAAEPVFRFDLINECLRELEKEERVNEQFFAQHGIEPCRLHYEDLTGAGQATTRRILDFLGIREPVSAAAFAAPKLEKQADGVSEDWRRAQTPGFVLSWR